VLHYDIFVFWKYLRQTVSAGQEIGRAVARLGAFGLQVGDAPDVGQAHSLANLTRHWQCVASEHFHWNAQIL
jgi:hypothetical protein